MRRLALPLASLSALVLAAFSPACGDDEDTTPTETVTYSGALRNGVDQAAIAGAEVCFPSHPDIDCFMTDSNGAYSVELPAETKVEVTVVKEGFISIASNFITRDADLALSAFMFPPAAVELGFQAVGATFDLTKGGLLVRVYDPALDPNGGLAGVAIDIDPSDGEGPFYSNGLLFDAEATVTEASGNAIFGSLEDKTYKVTFESTTHDCAGTYLWKSSDGRVEAKARAGFATYLYVDCPAK